jgi:hypothetical protein
MIDEILRSMQSRKFVVIILSSLLVASTPLLAQGYGNWRAADSSAKSITGDVTLTSLKVSINFSNFTIAQIRALTPAEISAVFNVDNASAGSGNLYRLDIPAEKRFLHHNTLCGSEDTQWMLTYASGRTLQLAFFSAAQMPTLTAEALVNATTLCGVFSYVR